MSFSDYLTSNVHAYKYSFSNLHQIPAVMHKHSDSEILGSLPRLLFVGIQSSQENEKGESKSDRASFKAELFRRRCTCARKVQALCAEMQKKARLSSSYCL